MVGAWLNEKYIAHRGFHNDQISENTVGAFENAIAHGYNIELDVQPTADNVAVVYHDTNMGRLTNCADFVENVTLDYLNNNVRYNGTGDKIPTFRQVLDVCNGRTGIMVEIKKRTYETPEIRVEPLVYDLLKNYKGNFIVKSFNPFSVDWFLKNAPGFTVGFLSEYDKITDYPEDERALIEGFLYGKNGERTVDFFDYAVSKVGSPLWNSVKGKMPCYVWVVRDKATQDKMLRFADNVIFENYFPDKE